MNFTQSPILRVANSGGKCFCGCGQDTGYAPRTSSRAGYKRGDRLRYIQDHNRGESSVAQRFIAKTKQLPNGCVEWIGAMSLNGYGKYWFRGRLSESHRVAYEFEHGSIDSHLCIDHLCRNRKCVNPSHMELVTQAENVRRGSNTKLTPQSVAQIRESNETNASLALRYNIDPSCISRIRSNHSWKD